MTDPRPPGPRDWKCDYDLTGTAVHIRPRNDHIWHPADDDCPCGPTSEYLDLDPDIATRWVVVHHALDGRSKRDGRYEPADGPTDGWGGDAGDDGPADGFVTA